MRVTLVISSLGAGGAERVMAAMANYWAEHDKEVNLITLTSEAIDWYRLHPKVNRVGLNLESPSMNIGEALKSNLQRITRLRHELQRARPDVVISFGDTTNVLTLMASLGLRIRVIISERVNPTLHSIGLAWGVLRSLVYRYADAVVVQSGFVRDWARRLVSEKAVYVIPNPVKPMLDGYDQASSCQGCGYTVVAMGRLARQKGFDLLLEAFGRCRAEHPGWSLVILGEGQERRRLETLAADLGLADLVTFPGVVLEPAQILRRADLFVMSSRYEGFPNALLEAMACGLAVISTDCATGPRDIIHDGVDGVLVQPNDVGSLAAAMDRLMADEAERQRLGARAVEVVERFSTEKIMKMWDTLLLSITSTESMTDAFIQRVEDRQPERRR